jgi:predicted RNA binding protein YcfA (HicA-like mRNA interferase family)
VIKVLLAHGWLEEPLLATGHRQFSLADGSRKVTVQHPERFGTRRKSLVFKSILRQMGISRATFAKWYHEK